MKVISHVHVHQESPRGLNRATETANLLTRVGYLLLPDFSIALATNCSA
jgi:hypothetical protein